MSIWAKVCVVLMVVLLFGVSGCGGSSGDGAGAESIAKPQFIQRGDSICRENYTKREQFLTAYANKLKASKKTLAPAKQEEVLVGEIMPIFEEELEELRQLPLPATGAQEAEQILAALDEAIQHVKENPAEALARGTGVAFARAEKLAHDYGFEYCGRS